MGENNANGGAAASFDGIIKGWPEKSTLLMSPIPEDETQLKRWLACNLFLNQSIQEVGFDEKDDNGNINHRKLKGADEVIKESIANVDKAVNEFVKYLNTL